MLIEYRDDLGNVLAEVEYVMLSDGFAWFSVDDVDYKVPIDHVMGVCEGKVEK